MVPLPRQGKIRFAVRIIAWALLANAVVVATSHAQVPCDRFKHVRIWEVTFDLAGKGEGPMPPGADDKYMLRQAVSASFVFAQPEEPACAPPQLVNNPIPRVVVDIDHKTIVVSPPHPDRVTSMARQGPVTDLQKEPTLLYFYIDHNAGTYSVDVSGFVNVQSSDGQSFFYPWGPGSGSVSNIPIPTSGDTLSGSKQFSGDAAFANRADWSVSWNVKGYTQSWGVFSDGRRFTSCNAVVDFLKTNRTTAEADVILNDPPELGPVKIISLPDGLKAERSVTWTLDEQASSITLPRWSWPRMSQAEKRALGDFVDALRFHEEGHFAVGLAVAARHSGPLSSDVRPTVQAAKDNLAEKLGRLRLIVMDEFDRKAGEKVIIDAEGNEQIIEGEYDKVTEHGAKQSLGPQFGFPGGKDVHLRCP